MDSRSGFRPNNSNDNQPFNRFRKLKQIINKRLLKISRMSKLAVEKLIYLDGMTERMAVNWLLRIYRSKFRLEWEFAKNPPHFYNHRMGMAQFTFDKAAHGPYGYYRGFYVSEVIRENDKLLDVGCGDGFFTKRFFSPRCRHVDGIDIELSAIQCAERENRAANITYHLLNAVEKDFPDRDYDVVVWDGAIGHFSSDTLDKVLSKITSALTQDGVFVGSESLGNEGSDHLTRFVSLDDLGKLFSKYFRHIELSSQEYKLGNGFVRCEAYWRCTQNPDRFQALMWKKYQ